jgi:hypothetical protein
LRVLDERGDVNNDSAVDAPPTVEPGSVTWRKSSFSTNGDCVTVGEYGDMIAVRDSKDPEGGTLFFTRSEMAAFVAGVKAGEFDDLT